MSLRTQPPPLPTRRDPAPRRAATERFVQQLRQFRERLLDINTRNPSLFLRRVVQSKSFDAAVLPEETVARIYAAVVRGKGTVTLVPEREDGDEAIKLRRHLQKLNREAQSRTEETGLEELYLGMCFLHGNLDAKTFVRGPLVLVPVTLTHVRKGRGAGWKVEIGGDVLVNEAILGAFRKYRGYMLPESIGDAVLEALRPSDAAGGGDDVPERAFGALAQAFRTNGLEATSQNFRLLHPIQSLTNEHLKATGVQPLTFASHLSVGLFPQASTALFSDLEAQIERAETGELDQGIVDNLLEAPADPENEAPVAEPDLDAVPEAEVHTVVQSDPSQLAAVIKAQQAECLVVRGPPGTGKSQVIVNLISDALARDKRVLVVCQKRAALDVVHERLAEVGLGDAAFVVHDAVKDRSALYKKLSARLADQSSPTAPTMSQALHAHSHKIDEITEAIRRIVEPLNQRFHGKRLYELYAAAQHGFQPKVEPPPEVVALDYEDLDRMASRLSGAKGGRLRFDTREHPLAFRKSWATLGHVDRSRLEEALLALTTPPDRPSASAIVLDRGISSTIQSDVRTVQAMAGKWWRFLHPLWWMAFLRLSKHRDLFGAIPPEQWLPRLELGDTLAKRIAALEPFMSDAWRERMLALAEDGLRLQEAAEVTLRAVRDDFSDIQAHDRLLEELSSTEVRYFDALAGRLGGAVDWGEHARQEVILRWIDEAEGQHPALLGRPFQEYANLKQQLEQLLDDKQKLVAAELAKVLRHRATTPSFPPDADVHGNRKASTDWSRLDHELTKKRRVKPLRTLLREFDWPMRQLMPCWLASPEVVSEIFPLQRGLFDVVIFDEASQLPVERALPVVYRGKQIVIAGDEQQMPPSRFFSAQLDELDDEDGDEVANEARLAESLLQQAKKIYGFDYLAWHYRSRYQELIDFSNHAFYDGKLHVAANVERQAAEPPIRWRRIDGTWENNINPAEVHACTDLLHEHLTRSQKAFRSVGIITFNMKQQEAIRDEIDRRRESDPGFAELMALAENPPSGNLDDRPFVKNIENVQGDERDHIIFSVGYAEDQDGRLRKRFGPLSVQGGENRLNVAITRARRRITVLCSFNPHELAVETSKNRGPVVFKRFLQYAKAVSEGDDHGVHGAISDVNPAVANTPGPRSLEFHSPFEEEVYDALRRHGYELETQWGVGGYRIDLAVVDPREPSRFCLGIECDGATYHSGKSVRERDIARQRFLETRGWTIERIWSRDWWVNPEGEVDRILGLLPDRS